MDPRKKRIYDKYGSFGLNVANQVGEEKAEFLLKLENPCVKVKHRWDRLQNINRFIIVGVIGAHVRVHWLLLLLLLLLSVFLQILLWKMRSKRWCRCRGSHPRFRGLFTLFIRYLLWTCFPLIAFFNQLLRTYLLTSL